jgi:hypothetical protein
MLTSRLFWFCTLVRLVLHGRTSANSHKFGSPLFNQVNLLGSYFNKFVLP